MFDDPANVTQLGNTPPPIGQPPMPPDMLGPDTPPATAGGPPEPQYSDNSGRKKYIIIGVIIFVILAVATGAFLLFRNTANKNANSNTAVNNANTNKTDNTNLNQNDNDNQSLNSNNTSVSTYTDASNNFTIQYPKDWTMTSASGQNDRVAEFTSPSVVVSNTNSTNTSTTNVVSGGIIWTKRDASYTNPTAYLDELQSQAPSKYTPYLNQDDLPIVVDGGSAMIRIATFVSTQVQTLYTFTGVIFYDDVVITFAAMDLNDSNWAISKQQLDTMFRSFKRTSSQTNNNANTSLNSNTNSNTNVNTNTNLNSNVNSANINSDLNSNVNNSNLNSNTNGNSNANENLDSDQDGLTDVMERALGTDPFNRDTDGDGYDDYTEVTNNHNPLGAG